MRPKRGARTGADPRPARPRLDVGGARRRGRAVALGVLRTLRPGHRPATHAIPHAMAHAGGVESAAKQPGADRVDCARGRLRIVGGVYAGVQTTDGNTARGMAERSKQRVIDDRLRE